MPARVSKCECNDTARARIREGDGNGEDNGDKGVGDSDGNGDGKGERAQAERLEMSQYIADVLSSRARQPQCHRSHFCDLVSIPDAGYLLLLLINTCMVLGKKIVRRTINHVGINMQKSRHKKLPWSDNIRLV